MRISDWSSDVCSSDLAKLGALAKKWTRRCVEEPAELASTPPSIRAYRQPTVGLRAQDRPHGLKPRLSAVIGRSTQIEADRKSVVWGKSVSVRVDPGGRGIIKKKKKKRKKRREL